MLKTMRRKKEYRNSGGGSGGGCGGGTGFIYFMLHEYYRCRLLMIALFY